MAFELRTDEVISLVAENIPANKQLRDSDNLSTSNSFPAVSVYFCSDFS